MVKNNTFMHGGSCYDLEQVQQVIFEDNHCIGQGMSPGNGIATHGGGVAQHVFLGGNTIEQVWGEDGDLEDGEFHILDAQVSFNVSEYDTVFTFEYLARLLLMALESHPAKNPNAQAAFARGRLF